MKTALVTTRVNNYWPELCEYTIPNLKRYAAAIGADFYETTERHYPDYHPAFEKLQVHGIAQRYDRTILVDADMLIHPRVPNLGLAFPDDHVALWMTYRIKGGNLDLWDPDKNIYFRRDRRNLGVVGCLVGCTRDTCDIFDPDPAVDVLTMQDVIYRPAIIDEYMMSRNVAKYGLKVAFPWNSHAAAGIWHADATTKNAPDIMDLARRLSKEWA